MYVFVSLTILSHIAQKLNEVDACLVVPGKFVFTYFCQLSRIDFLSRISLRCTFQKKEKQRIKMTSNVEGIFQQKKMCTGITHLNRSYVRILCGTQCETLFFFTFFYLSKWNLPFKFPFKFLILKQNFTFKESQNICKLYVPKSR